MAEVEAIIVGSGFGGSVVAERLARAGRSVLILERGDWWHRANDEGRERRGEPMAYRRPDGSTQYIGGRKLFEQAVDPHYVYSLYEDIIGDDMVVGVAAAVGGGSVVFSNVAERAPRRVFDHHRWPTYTDETGRTRAWDYSYLSQLYDRVEGVGGRPPGIQTHIPTIEPPRYQILKHVLEALYGPGIFPLARVAVQRSVGDLEQGRLIPETEIGACRNCGFCNFGCVYAAQQNLMANYLQRAEAAGARIWPNKNVTRLSFNPTTRWWTVFYRECQTGVFLKAIKNTSEEKSLTARIVVLAAGTLGTPRILLNSALAGLSPHVGYHLSGNGDYVSGAFLPPPGTWRIGGLTSVDGFKGRVIAGITRTMAQTEGWVIEDLWVPPVGIGGKFLVRLHDPEWAEEGTYEHHGGANPIYLVSRWKNPSLYGLRQKRLIEQYPRRGLPVAFLGEDGCDGRMWLEGDRVRISAPSQLHYQDYLQAMISIVAHLPEGSRWLETDTERRNGRFFTSVHPLGTCRMAAWPGRDPSDDGGVVDGNGRVFSSVGAFDNLFIADGSVIPCATIVNPSWTIVAVAEHIANFIATYGRW